MRINASLIGVVSCAVAIAGLVIPLGPSAEASGTLGKSVHDDGGLVVKSSADNNCLKGGKTSLGASCDDDSVAKKIPKEPDRKGHKVKKARR